MINEDWYITQDNCVIPNDIYNFFKETFDFGDIYKSKEHYISKFVGFIFFKGKWLVSFPKHYFSNDSIRSIQDKQNTKKLDLLIDIKMLYNVLQKTVHKKPLSTLGFIQEVNLQFPFTHFFEIYDYYLKYGLYTNEVNLNKLRYSGKIDWKKTISKSSMIISNGEIIYIPFVTKSKIKEYEFIGKCMAYVINSTANVLRPLFNFKTADLFIKDINWENKKLILSHLRKINGSMFKDTEKKLVHHLINFFEDKSSSGFKFKTTTFNLVWEEMIRYYLNHYFENVTTTGFINFSEEKKLQQNLFEKKIFYPDKYGKRLEPDYYLIDQNKNVRYIFDAKYYDEIKELDYKQVAYYFLLKHHYKKQVKPDSQFVTHNILILPTHTINETPEKYKTHFALDEGFNLDESDFQIKEQYCHLKTIMNAYIS